MKKQLLLNFLFGLILLGCTNNKSIDDVLMAKSQLTIDECWVELLTPLEFNIKEVDNLIVHEFLKYRVGLIKIQSFEVLLTSVKYGNQISIPSEDLMITPPPSTPNQVRKEEYLALYKRDYKFPEKQVSNKSINKISFEDAKAFMEARCASVGQTLMLSKTTTFDGYKVFVFLSVAENGSACISSVNEYKLEVMSTACGNADIKMNQWNSY
jgi:hypothetical protein